MDMSKNIISDYMSVLGRKGGKQRALKTTLKQRKIWGKLGGRPKKSYQQGVDK